MIEIQANSILDALRCNNPRCECQRTGSKKRHCPAHEDTYPSLAVDEKSGKVLVRCHAGCTQEEVLGRLRDLELWPKPQGDGHAKLEAVYPYRDEHNQLLYEVVRFAEKDGAKKFAQRRPNGGGFTWGVRGTRLIPYRLPLLKAAVEGGQRVYVVEGEKDADNLLAAGLMATTSPMGAGKWRDEYAQHFTNARVAILPDNDELGRAHAEDVARSLEGTAADVRVLALADLPPKGDVSDWLGAGNTIQALETLVANTPRWGTATDLRTKDLLRDIIQLISQYIKLPSDHAAVTIGLWVLHAWTIEAADITPYLIVRSATKRAAKSNLLQLLGYLTPRPWRVTQPSEAVLFRKIAETCPTLLLDETDAIFHDRGATYEGLRAILNAGYERGITVPRCVGEGSKITLTEFAVFSAKALAGIGRLPDTIEDRGVLIEMRRATRDEERGLRKLRRSARNEADPLNVALAQWAQAALPTLRDARPTIPLELDGRASDLWEPLLAIADLAGDDWATSARRAALALSTGEAREDDSFPIRLLADIRSVFDSLGTERATTADLIAALVEDNSAPWGDWWKGQRITGRALADLLKPFRIFPAKWRTGAKTERGYFRKNFADAWAIYLSPVEPPQPPQAPQVNTDAGFGHFPEPPQVPFVAFAENAANPYPERVVADVAVVAVPGGRESP